MSDDYTPTQSQNLAESSRPELSPEYPQLGQKLLNRYEIFAIKRGGFGIVLYVTDLETNRQYAVKTYKAELIDALPNKEQFKAEVNFWVNLDPHPNIVQAYSAETIEDQLYLFMEYVPNTLRDLMNSGEIDTNKAIDLAYQICLGMEFLNKKKKKVHADLKPENILITSENIAKVTDFGLANLVSDLPRVSAGTLPYMSLEHFFGGVIDERSDIFSFGVMFYEMLTGYLPHPLETRGLTISGWREILRKLYEKDDGTIPRTDDYRSTFWREIQNINVDERLKHLVFTCILPYSLDRWESFHQLRKHFEEWLHDRIYYRVADNELADLYSRALTLHEIGRLSKALAVYNRALQKYPDNAELWRDAAYALIDANMHPTALGFIAQAKRLNPNLEIPLQKIITILNYLGEKSG